MEEAEHALWRAAGLSIAPPARAYGFPRVSMTCDYRSPLRFEDEFETWIRITAITERSIRYRCDVIKDGTPAASMTMAIVCVQTDASGELRAAPLPEAVRTRLEVAADAVA
jgi:acyl-CoA thioester hydrolase